MKNKNGSVLIVTLGFVVAFTLLGMASLHYAMMENEATELQKASMGAFWLADGAVEYAKAELPVIRAREEAPIYAYETDGIPDSNHHYDYLTQKKSGYENRWEVLTYGSINNQERYIQAEITKFNLPDCALCVTEKPENSPTPWRIIPPNPDPFPSNDEPPCVYEYTDDAPITSEGFRDTTCVTVESTQNVYVPAPNTGGSSDVFEEGDYVDFSDNNLLVINVTTLNDDGIVPSIFFDGPIEGVVVIYGDAKLQDFIVNGSVIADGKLTFVGENNGITLDAEVIDKVSSLAPLNGFTTTHSKTVVTWKELDKLDEEI